MKPITAALLGAGHRGADAYAAYALRFPHELRMVAVAEPRAQRRASFCKEHQIEDGNSFSSWEQLLAQPRLADCVFVCTQDKMHYEPVMQALALGYHILCEKPMSPDAQELAAMRDKAAEKGLIFSVCHVLRYSPFFEAMQQMLHDNAIGQLVSVQHMESIGYWHMAHSFVRGNWRSTQHSSPIVLAKCCHDIDILSWLVASRCTRVSSFGSLAHFKKENAPVGAPVRCTDGCAHRTECPYYAPRFYLEHPRAVADGFVNVLTTDLSTKGILQALATGPYGRCVYHCDNDVVDHQVVNLEYENGVTVSMTLCAFTEQCERSLTLMGTHGQIKANMEENRIDLFHFASGRHTMLQPRLSQGGHGGSDTGMMRDFVALVATDGHAASRSSAAASVESHLIALAAEKSRANAGAVVQL